MKIGRWMQGKGGIPTTGSDQYILFRVFQNQEKPFMIQNINYHSGDAGDKYQLYVAPPSAKLDGTETVLDLKGSYGINTTLLGAAGTLQDPRIVPTQQGSGFPMALIPPYWSIAVCDLTGASAADFKVQIGGYEIE